jgi:hypothetical protein
LRYEQIENWRRFGGELLKKSPAFTRRRSNLAQAQGARVGGLSATARVIRAGFGDSSRRGSGSH